MAASILASEPVRLQGVPRLADVDILARVLEELGVAVTQTARGELLLETVDTTPVIEGCTANERGRSPVSWRKDVEPRIECANINKSRYGLARRMRASFCVLGPLLARRGKAIVPLPGGCNIGDRPVDLHLKGLATLGAELRIEHGYVRATAGRLRGATIDLGGRHGSTVTGTANVMSAAVLAEGLTTITPAAVEPEIVDLGNFLRRLGARIDGLGTPTIRIEGVDQLAGTDYRIIPDRIEAATLLLAAAITGGSATVTGLIPKHLTAVVAGLRAAGLRVDVGRQSVSVAADGPPRPTDITAEPYPGVPTDIQAQWMALLSLARGKSTVRDRVFPQRFMHVAELNRLGARIERRGALAVVDGVRRLSGAVVTASDLRASAALVMAGLAADGRTVVRQIHHLDRGYERLDHKLGQLGARIERSVEKDVTEGVSSRTFQSAGHGTAELCFRRKVDEGLRQLDAGEGIDHEEAKRRLGKWIWS